MNTKHYTSIEQSKKLLELGLNPETADMHYLFENFITQPIIKIEVGYNKDEEEKCLEDNFAPEYIPCWSLGALLGVIPFPTQITTSYKNARVDIIYKKEIENSLHTETAETLLETLVQTICWLLNNGYIKKESKTSSE